MKIQILLFFTILGVVTPYPSNIVDFETDLMEVEQEGTPGKAVEGEYSWIAPNGKEVYVKYRADNRGFQVLDSDNTIAGGGDFDSPYDASASAPVAVASEADEEEVAIVQPVVKSVVAEEADAPAPAEEEEEEEEGEEEREEDNEEEEGEEEDEEENKS